MIMALKNGIILKQTWPSTWYRHLLYTKYLIRSTIGLYYCFDMNVYIMLKYQLPRTSIIQPDYEVQEWKYQD